MTRIKQAPAEEQWQAFLAWLPSDLRHVPGIDWTRLPAQAMAFCTRVVGESPDAAYLAMAAGAASGRISASSLLRLLRHLRAFLTTMRTRCGLQRVSDLRREALWNAYAQHIRETRTRSQQLAAYSAASTRHLPQYLNGIEEAGDVFTMQQYQLPPMPGGFLARVGRANELNSASRVRTHRARDFLLPLYPLLGELALLRKQLVERLLDAFRLARQQVLVGASLPLPFSYADSLSSLHGEGSRWEIRRRTLTLNFILWNRRSWVLAHRDSFGEWTVLEAQHARGVYSPAQDEYFVQFDGPARDLFWFGDLIVQGLLGHLSASSKGATSAERLGRARELGFLYGCATHLGGLLHAQSRWFAENARPGELLFEPEALYRGVLYGAALVTLALTTGGALSELLQVSADRWLTTPGGRFQHLLPERARGQQERRPFAIGPQAALLLEEMARALRQKASGEVPLIPPSAQLSNREVLIPERYLFQWRGSMVDPHDTQVLARFLLHGINFPSSDEGKSFRLSMELLRYGGGVSLEERGQILQRALGFNQTVLDHLSPSSLDLYCRELFAYWQFAESREAALQPLTLARWMVQLGKLGHEMSTINRAAGVVQQIFAVVGQRGLIERERAEAFEAIEKLRAEEVSPAQDRARVSFSQSYKKCGKPACEACRRGRGHGPYWYAYRREGGKEYTAYVGREKTEGAVARALHSLERRIDESARAEGPPSGPAAREVSPDALAPLVPALCRLARERARLVERLLAAIVQARGQLTGEDNLPVRFQHADTIPELHVDPLSHPGGTIRERAVILTLTLWDKRRWVREHPDRYTPVKVRLARQGVAAYRDDRNTLFVQLHAHSAHHLWFGELLEHNLLQVLEPHKAPDDRNGRRPLVARDQGFPRGCHTNRAGLLSTGDPWFAENARPGELLFEPEALYRGVLYGAALVTLALESGFGRRELLQVSADRWASPGKTERGGSRLQLLSVPGASSVEGRQRHEVGLEAAELLAQIERVLVQVHGGVPVVHATDRVRGLKALRPERYLFQWQGGVVDPDSLTVLGRFVLHGLRLPGGERLTGLTPDLLKESSPCERDLLRLRDALLAPLAPGLAPGTLTTYQQNLLRYLRFAGSPEQAYQPETLARWLASLSQERPGGRRLALASVDGMAMPVRSVMAEAGRAGRLAPDRAASFGALKARPSGNQRPPSGRREGWPVRTVEPERAAPDGDDEKRATGS